MNNYDELRQTHTRSRDLPRICGECGELYPCTVSQLVDENAALRAAIQDHLSGPIRLNDEEWLFRKRAVLRKALGDAS